MNIWIEHGGIIMKVLIALNIIGYSIMIWKAFSLVTFKMKMHDEIKVFEEFYTQCGKGIAKISEDERLAIILSHYISPYRKGLTSIRIIATVAPLLGLLGTALGILDSFTVISQEGLGDPSIFAKGISMALITTVGGLVVSIPHFIGFNFLNSSLVSIENSLEELLVLGK